MRRRFLNNKSVKIDIDQFLTIKALEDDVYIMHPSEDLQYAIDGEGWQTLPAGTFSPHLKTNQTISLQGVIYNKGKDPQFKRFNVHGMFSLMGNCMSVALLKEGGEFNLSNLFENCSTLREVTSNFLPATTLTDSCYQYMFSYCHNLSTPPELPATTLADRCYYSMFSYCISLETAPELPATTLTNSCYSFMFAHCESLETAPELPATTLTDSCYEHMFYDCISLITPPELPATILATNCYGSMFALCESLETAPELPVTTLADRCYYSMFSHCISLETAPELPATTLTNSCYKYMFAHCDFNTAPELPATTLVDNCYSYMFLDCVHLTYIKMLATSKTSTSLTNWVSGVIGKGTFVKSKNMSSLPLGESGIPEGWAVENY